MAPRDRTLEKDVPHPSLGVVAAACSRKPQQPEANIRFHDCSRTSMQLTEFLWNQVRPNLPSKKKQRVKEGTVLVLGDRLVAEQHRQILKLGPKFCLSRR
ncbi:hypothetical protein HPB47_011940 [Ixodes persulcatus]|uniref:Uncharacterized protein n=1 Tax=Ixodes persulcatus TaxID=34615 RepID=A0AC60NV12_IXOPE|nr:hypothetical protein HPB47_011940 [Ixodes persulcatus]